jgi:hypothetical protein
LRVKSQILPQADYDTAIGYTNPACGAGIFEPCCRGGDTEYDLTSRRWSECR